MTAVKRRQECEPAPDLAYLFAKNSQSQRRESGLWAQACALSRESVTGYGLHEGGRGGGCHPAVDLLESEREGKENLAPLAICIKEQGPAVLHTVEKGGRWDSRFGTAARHKG